MLEARHPLAGIAEPGHYGRAGTPGVVAELRTGLALASVAGNAGTARVTTAGDVTFVWSGPDQWLALSEAMNGPQLVAALRPRFAAVADQSDARLVLRLSGPRVRDTLAKGLAVDLDSGEVWLSAITRISVQLWRAGDDFTLTVPRSFAGSFWRWLAASAAEYGLALST